MRGTLHRKILDQQQVELGPGCGLFLKQVTYLDIYMYNFIRLFPSLTRQLFSCNSSNTKLRTLRAFPSPKVSEKAFNARGLGNDGNVRSCVLLNLNVHSKISKVLAPGNISYVLVTGNICKILKLSSSTFQRAN